MHLLPYSQFSAFLFLLQEIGDRDGDEDAKARLMGITREQLLCDIDREKYRKLFRMPKEETLMSGRSVAAAFLYCSSYSKQNTRVLR